MASSHINSERISFIFKKISSGASILAVVCALLAPTLTTADTPTSIGKQYVSKWSATAVSEMKRSGIPASITLAQGLLESNFGKSPLATKANNHFGIKCHDWKGEKTYHDDDHKGECFRKYSKAEDSFKDHSDFLRYRDRYKFLFDIKITDYKGWCYGLKKAGYATDPQYPQKLINLIETYNLTRFDTGVVVPDTPNELETPVAAAAGEVVKFSMSRQIYSQNKVPFVYSLAGESYASIAESNNLFLREILKFNDLSKTRELEPGTVVYLRAKKGKAAKHVDKYVAEGGETMWEISQRFGIKLKKLLKMNGVGRNYQVRSEDEIRLR